MIDTENADGDVYKMFLGSFLEDMDNKLIQGGATTDTLSALTPTASMIDVANRASHTSQFMADDSWNYSTSPGPSNRSTYGPAALGISQNNSRTSIFNDRNSRVESSFGVPYDSAPTSHQSTIPRHSPSPGDFQQRKSYSSRYPP